MPFGNWSNTLFPLIQESPTRPNITKEGVAGNRNIPIASTFGKGLRHTKWHGLEYLTPRNLVGWVPQHFTTGPSNGVLPVCSPKFCSEVWPIMLNCKWSLGSGKQQIVRPSKHRWPESPLQTRRMWKKGSKQHILIDENKIPNSLLVSEATSMTAWLWTL